MEDQFGEMPYKLKPGWFWRDTGNGDGGGGGGDESADEEAEDQEQPEAQDKPKPKEDDVEGLKSALKKERQARRKAEKELRSQPEYEYDEDDEFDEDEYFAEVEEAALARMLEAEVKVAAAGKVVDPELVVALLMDEEFSVDDDGNFDQDEIKEAIDDLIKERPYLAAKNRSRRSGGDFSSNGDSGKAPDMNDILRGAVRGA